MAVDNIAVKPGRACRGHCTFEGDFCGWTNDDEDDFEWFLVNINVKTSLLDAIGKLTVLFYNFICVITTLHCIFKYWENRKNTHLNN